MRITNNIMTNNLLRSLNLSQQRQNTLEEQLADGRIIHRPSDDPVRAVRSLRFNNNLSMNDQYQQNLKDAQSWMDTSDSAMSDVGSLLMHAKELVIRATAPNPDIAYEAAGEELDGVINQLIQVGNTQVGDRYIFSGQQDKTSPFVRNGDAIIYNGDNNKISMRIQGGPQNSREDSVNITGTELFGATQDTLNQLIAIKNQLNSGAPDLNYLSTTALQSIDDAHDRSLQAQAVLGTRSAMYEMAGNMLTEDNNIITKDVSANEDLDMPKALIDLNTNQNIYKSALSVGAKIIQPSLVDFLR